LYIRSENELEFGGEKSCCFLAQLAIIDLRVNHLHMNKKQNEEAAQTTEDVGNIIPGTATITY
jgi:hypothetical protein